MCHDSKAQLLLPFAEREYVDMPRACRILGTSATTVVRMAASGYLQLIEYRERAWKKIRYRSIVEHCDRLRVEYAIPDTRPALANELLRHKDEDILPFPMRDTIYIRDIVEPLGFACKQPATKIVEEGRFLAYRLHPGAAWRIHAPSFREYLSRTLQGVSGGPRAYKSAAPGL